MRAPILIAAVLLSGCQTATEPPTRSAKAQERLDKLLAGRTPGETVTCVSDFRLDNMTVIDENTLAFESGGTVYINNLSGACSRLGAGGYALKTERLGGTGLCRGEIAQVVDTTTGMTAGACSFGDFVPYRRS